MENEKRLDLIDRNALMDSHWWNVMKDPFDKARAKIIIQSAKTVDAVEVVRCKGCKHWGGVVYGGRCRYWSAPMSGMTHYTSADDFCSHGERKDNGSSVQICPY